MTRLCAFICCLAGCYVAVRYPDQWQTVGALIGGGAAALLSRQKKAVQPTTGPPSSMETQ